MSIIEKRTKDFSISVLTIIVSFDRINHQIKIQRAVCYRFTVTIFCCSRLKYILNCFFNSTLVTFNMQCLKEVLRVYCVIFGGRC